MSQDLVQQIDANIAESRKIVELSKALDRLSMNKDFKEVITDGYLTKEAVRLVHLKAAPQMQTPDRQAAINNSIDAIGGLLEYFRTVRFNAQVALKAIESDEETREELLAGGGEQ